MKKLFTLLMLGATMSVSAQQLANGTFDADWVDCHPWEKGAYLKSARGKQPQGWCMANVNGMGGLGATEVGSEGVGRSGSGKSAVMTNTPNPLSAQQVVPGYMTLGTAWATAKATISGSVTAGTADGGVFGGISFTSRPDALHFYYKRAHNVENTTKSPTNLTEVASVIAYSWTGTWSQAEVPSNTAMGAPTKVTMTDRSNNILGKDCLTGGTITKTNDAVLISVIEYYISGDASSWTELTIPFEYKNTAKVPEKFNIVFSANDIFADRALMGAGNQLTVDDVELLYWNTLSSLKYDGSELLEGETTSYSVDAEYDAAKLVAVAKSQFASVSTSYDEVTAVATVTVTRENAENKTYTIQFTVPSSELDMAATKYNGSAIAFEGGSATVDALYDESLLNLVPVHSSASVEKSYDEETAVLTVTVKAANFAKDATNKHVYTIQFTVPSSELDMVATKYNGSAIAFVDGSATVDALYEEGLLNLVPVHSAASVEKSYDEETAILTVTVKAANFAKDATNKHVYTIQFNKPMAEIAISVSFNTKYDYITFCAPFATKTPHSGYVDSYTVDGLEDNGATLVLTHVTGNGEILPAHTPVLLKNSYYETAIHELRGFPTEGTPKAGLLTGTYEDIKAPKGSYVLQYQNETLGFYKVEDVQPTVKAYRAYLNVDSNVKAFGFSTENGATAIKALEALTSGKPEIYDLNGRKLNKLQKGVNIVNGVKVLVK